MEINNLKNKILKNRKDIVDIVRYDDIRDYMIQELFTLHDDEEINASRTNREKMSRFLDLLNHRGQKAYDVFFKSLTDGYSFMQKQITQTELPADEQTNAALAKQAGNEIEHETMRRLCRRAEVMKEWKMLGRTLGLEECDIFEIEEECKHKPSECLYQTLSKWKSMSRLKAATIGELCKALSELKLVAAAEDVLQD